MRSQFSQQPKTNSESEDSEKFEKEIIQKIKQLPVAQRINAVLIHQVLKKRRELVLELDKYLLQTQRKIDIESLPAYREYNDIALGIRGPKPQELEIVDQSFAQQMRSLGNKTEEIPMFWSKVLNHFCSENYSNPAELDVLDHLTKVEVNMIGNSQDDFQLSFYFKPNEFFSNEVLHKRFWFRERKSYEIRRQPNEYFLTKTESTKINWRPGKDITIATRKKRIINKTTRAIKIISEEIERKGFFTLFCDLSEKSEDSLEASQISEDLRVHQYMGKTLYDYHIPYAQIYYVDYKNREQQAEFHKLEYSRRLQEIIEESEQEGQNDFQRDQRPNQNAEQGENMPDIDDDLLLFMGGSSEGELSYDINDEPDEEDDEQQEKIVK